MGFKKDRIKERKKESKKGEKKERKKKKNTPRRIRKGLARVTDTALKNSPSFERNRLTHGIGGAGGRDAHGDFADALLVRVQKVAGDNLEQDQGNNMRTKPPAGFNHIARLAAGLCFNVTPPFST